MNQVGDADWWTCKPSGLNINLGDKLITRTCVLRDSIIRDQIVFSIKDTTVKEHAARGQSNFSRCFEHITRHWTSPVACQNTHTNNFYFTYCAKLSKQMWSNYFRKFHAETRQREVGNKTVKYVESLKVSKLVYHPILTETWLANIHSVVFSVLRDK